MGVPPIDDGGNPRQDVPAGTDQTAFRSSGSKRPRSKKTSEARCPTHRSPRVPS